MTRQQLFDSIDEAIADYQQRYRQPEADLWSLREAIHQVVGEFADELLRDVQDIDALLQKAKA